MTDKVVVLPAPLAPNKPKTAFFGTVNDKELTACFTFLENS